MQSFRISSDKSQRNAFPAAPIAGVLSAACTMTAWLFLLCGVPTVHGQTTMNDVHVTPRTEPRDDGPLKTGTKPLRVDVDVVLIPVTVTDPMDRLVTGLGKEHFTLFEDKERQQLRYFSSEDAPISLGVIFDVSGSMKEKMERAREAVVEFLRMANPQDEFFLVSFSEKPQVQGGFTSEIEEIQSRLVFTNPKGHTALFDAIYVGLNQMREASHRKRALLLISDGGDNHSRYTEREVKSRLKEADVQLYAIGIYDNNFPTEEEKLGPYVLSELADVTGGRAFTVTNPNDLPDVAAKIGIELRNQYVLGYVPDEDTRDGKWRKVKVKIHPPKGLPPLRVYAKKGYFGLE